MKFYKSLFLLGSLLLLPAVSNAATLYDETIVDGTRQAREGNPVIPPLTFTASFLNTPTPNGTGTLEITASGDFDASSEYLDIYIDGAFIDSAFQFAGLEITTQRSFLIPLATMLLAAADSAIDISLVGTSGGGANVNILTVDSVRLSYSSVPLPASLPLMVGAIGALSVLISPKSRKVRG